MINLIQAGKAFDRIQQPYVIKTLQKVSIERNELNITKAIYDKTTANILHHGEKLKVFPIRPRIREGCPLLLLFFNVALEVVAMSEKKQK